MPNKRSEVKAYWCGSTLFCSKCIKPGMRQFMIQLSKSDMDSAPKFCEKCGKKVQEGLKAVSHA